MHRIFIILMFSYLLRRYSFLFYRGKIEAKDKAGSAVPELKVLHPEVLEALTEWRRQRAMNAHMPTYCILQQKALIAIANLLPQDKEALAKIPFCGNVKAEKYGDEVLAVVKNAIEGGEKSK